MNPSSYATAQQLFLSALAKILYNDDSFLTESIDLSEFAVGKTVNWNEEGGIPPVKFNSTTGHGAAVQEVDILRNFNLDEVITRPSKIDWTEEQVVNYSKRASLMERHTRNARQESALRIAFRWSPTATANLIPTTGTPRPSLAVGATTNRNAATLVDFLNAMKRLDILNVPRNGRVGLLTPQLHMDLLSIQQATSGDFVFEKPLVGGYIGTWLGVKWYLNAYGVQYNAAGVPQLPKVDDTFTPYAGATTDRQCAMIWHPDFVTRAFSKNSLVSLIPVHGGDELSTTMLIGGARKYNSGLGVVGVLEA